MLLTVDEGLGSLAAVRALRSAGHEPFAGTWRPDTYAARSRAVAGHVALPDPQLEPDAHAQAIVRVVERERFAAVLPGTELSLQALADHPRSSLPTVPSSGWTRPTRLLRATDKRLLHRLASEAGLDALPQRVHTGATLDDKGAGMELPVVVKPLRSVQPATGSGLDVVEVRSARTTEELHAAVAHTHPIDHGSSSRW